MRPPIVRPLLVAMAMTICFLTSCGEQGDSDIDRRYQECIDAGGDFDAQYNDDFSCTNIPDNQQ